MTNHQCGRHADVYFLTSPLLLNHLLRLLSNRFQTVDEKFGDAWYQLHHGTHRHTEEQHLLDIQLSHSTYQRTYNHTQYNRLTQHTEFLFQSLRIDIELRESRNLIQQPVDADSECREALTERLRDGDTVHIVVVALELISSQIGHHQCDDVTDDGSKIAPRQTLVHHEIGHSTDKGEVPVVPQVDVHCTCTFCNKQQEIHTQTNGDDQCAHSCIISHCRSSGPTHIKHTELQVIEL